ncbi:MAG: OprD family outer membrane porin [Sulfuricurvum sp.]|nr:OprD family outer membrane porin [Sulfuricurvum sp.]
MYPKSKIIVMTLAASTQFGLFAAVIPEDKGTVSGLIRLGYVDQDNVASTDTYATALGGILKYETPVWNDLKLGIAGYASQKLHFATGSWDEGKTNSDFFDADGKSFAYLGEAYVDYTANDLNIRIGRQLIDTPFVNTDEIRMLPNTFEAAMATYGGIEKTTVTAGFIKRWAGYDSPRGHNDSINEFKKFGETHESTGTYLLGITNERISDLLLQGWFYSIDEVTDIAYADATYKILYSDIRSLKFSAQAAHFAEDRDTTDTMTGINGNVIGLAANYEWGMVTLGAAYNEAFNKDGKFIGLGLGGGPYYTSMEEWTIDGMEDARAYRGSIIVNLSDAGIRGWALCSAYGAFKSVAADQKIDEWDIVATYAYGDALSTDISYAKIDDKHDNADGSNGDAGYDRFLVRLSYRF